MFYCKACEKKNDWPSSILESFGPCEICGTITICNDRPSYQLPLKEEEDAKKKN